MARTFSMEMSHSIIFTIEEESGIGAARRQATALAKEIKSDATFAGKVAIVATEIATNLVKHARSGRLLLEKVVQQEVPGIEILALDRGPGISNMGESLRDGYSTSGSPGTGLGAIRRLSDVFDIYSTPGKGTALVARLWSAPLPAHSDPLELGAVSVAKPGETACGDAWSVRAQDGRVFLMLADGLGHGHDAAAASQEAVQTFSRKGLPDLGAMIQAMHEALRSTRGAAVAVGEILLTDRVFRFSGVGNIAGILHSAEKDRHLVSHDGIVGHALRRVQTFDYAFPDGTMLVMYSDGLKTRWRLNEYPGLSRRHPSLIAAVLYRDYSRGYDDVGILVARRRLNGKNNL